MNSVSFTKRKNTTEHLAQTGALMGDSIPTLCHSFKSTWSSLSNVNAARDDVAGFVVNGVAAGAMRRPRSRGWVTSACPLDFDEQHDDVPRIAQTLRGRNIHHLCSTISAADASRTCGQR